MRLLPLILFLVGSVLLGEGLRDPKRPLAEEIGFDQKLSQTIPKGLVFQDEAGNAIQLASYFGHHKPVLLALVYFGCPSLCTMVLNGLFRSLQAIGFKAGKEFEAVVVSIDPKEKSELASTKKKNYTEKYVGKDWEKGLHFLTGTSNSIDQLAASVGFRYRYDPVSKVYAHPGGIVLLTPEGKISQYFFGVDYPSRELRLGLVTASNGKIGNLIDHFMLFCYRYDPTVGKYGLMIFNLLRLAGIFTILLIGGYIFYALRSERRSITPKAHQR